MGIVKMINNEENTQKEELEDITGVTCVYVPVRDVYSSVQWYQKNLGCLPTKHNPVEPGMEKAIMRFPDHHGYFADAGLRQLVPALILIAVKHSAEILGFTLDNGARHPVLCFITPRIYEIYDRFKENGVNILTDMSNIKPGGPYLSFTDPDGNLFAIWQP
jgi:catechol 2,3-dioxygenase-like lactoylglutathione lyase family enzyme